MSHRARVLCDLAGKHWSEIMKFGSRQEYLTYYIHLLCNYASFHKNTAIHQYFLNCVPQGSTVPWGVKKGEGTILN